MRTTIKTKAMMKTNPTVKNKPMKNTLITKMSHSYVIDAEPITTSKTLKTALNKTLYVPTYLSELTSKIQKFAKKLPMQSIANV